MDIFCARGLAIARPARRTTNGSTKRSRRTALDEGPGWSCRLEETRCAVRSRPPPCRSAIAIFVQSQGTADANSRSCIASASGAWWRTHRSPRADHWSRDESSDVGGTASGAPDRMRDTQQDARARNARHPLRRVTTRPATGSSAPCSGRCNKARDPRSVERIEHRGGLRRMREPGNTSCSPALGNAGHAHPFAPPSEQRRSNSGTSRGTRDGNSAVESSSDSGRAR